MLSLQSIMLLALGFVAASLLALMIAPAFRRRAMRLAADRIKATMPLTIEEITADKDRLRAEHAIAVHALETRVEHADYQRARHLIDLNRREAEVSDLRQQLAVLSAQIEENQNARRVLELTVADRLPRVEQRLAEAKAQIDERDQAITELETTARRQQSAIEEATQINAQKEAEVERLTTALATRGARNQNATADPRFEGELALRSEIEALRAKTRDQANVIARLQSTASSMRGKYRAANDAAPLPAAEEATARPQLPPVVALDQARADLERELRQLKTANDDLTSEAAKLKAALAAYEAGTNAEETDSRMSLKAKLGAAEADRDAQLETVKRLRAELAAANERLALQAAHFMEEMRRLGAGTLPVSAPQRRSDVTQPARLSLAERVAQSRPSLTPVPSETPDTVPERETTEPPSGAAAAAVAASPADVEEPGIKTRLIDRISRVSKT